MKMHGLCMQKSSNFAYFSYQHQRILWWLHLFNFPLELDFFALLLWSKTFLRFSAESWLMYSSLMVSFPAFYILISAHVLCIPFVFHVYLVCISFFFSKCKMIYHDLRIILIIKSFLLCVLTKASSDWQIVFWTLFPICKKPYPHLTGICTSNSAFFMYPQIRLKIHLEYAFVEVKLGDKPCDKSN